MFQTIKKVRVVHINTNINGGAGNAMLRIHKLLVAANVNSSVLTLYKTSNTKNFFSIEGNMDKVSFIFKNYYNRIRQQFNSLFNKYSPISSPYSEFDLLNHPAVKNADIIHLHWVSKLIDYPSFFTNIDKPVVWTLHDMAPFTGGNHYTIGYDLEKMILVNNLEIKLKALNNNNVNLTLVCPSEWLSNLSRQSKLFNKYSHYVVRNPIDMNIFSRKSKTEVRKKYKIDEDDNLILFLAENIEDKRKGIDYFQLAIKYVKTQNLKLVIVGKGKIEFPDTIPVIQMGFINDVNDLVNVYNLVDVFVTTSLEDNFPNTIIESLACGTPVVGYNNSGIKEMILHKQNGYLATYQSAEDIGNGIDWILSNKSQINFSDSAIKFAEKLCNKGELTRQYLDVYETALKI